MVQLWFLPNIEGKLQLMTDPPECFCGKSAFRTDGYLGVSYDCHEFQNQDAEHVCDFHIHEHAWHQFRRQLLSCKDVNQNDPELNVCPFFNYAYCILFGCANDYPKKFLAAPTCHCHLSATLVGLTDVRSTHKEEEREEDYGYWHERYAFKCPHHNVHVDDSHGARSKCTWSLVAKNTAFTRPKRLLHSNDIDTDLLSLRGWEGLIDKESDD
ncbi:hypothetical protein BDA99DRAFT_554159 [Phascolomyces articulosus]|uniref:Uncharacterized protein n=1 Tax=Phascolomyces articulosus TaxID=60185 RepID=A0AAD5PMF2_9FUNG|nr:hypothetical protein BDA99DRAFT_554159 [Phascolomyces articulosus]